MVAVETPASRATSPRVADTLSPGSVAVATTVGGVVSACGKRLRKRLRTFWQPAAGTSTSLSPTLAPLLS